MLKYSTKLIILRQVIGKFYKVIGVIEVTAEEITKIKDRIARAYGALIVGEAYNILEAAKTPMEKEKDEPSKD